MNDHGGWTDALPMLDKAVNEVWHAAHPDAAQYIAERMYEDGWDVRRAATPEPTLDAERLERAFVTVIDRRPHKVEVTYFYGDSIPVEHQRAAFLRDIAAEYARLHERTASQDAGTDG